MPTEAEIAQDVAREKAYLHSLHNPDGCPDWCKACQERLICKGGRHEWPREFSDGDTCYCGQFYLIANAVDERPHVIEARAVAETEGGRG